MAKKHKKGRNKNKGQSLQSAPVREPSESQPIVYERKQSIFQSIYDLSIGRFRVVALLFVLIGLILIAIGSFSLFKTIKEKLDEKKVAEGDINGGIQTDSNDSNEDNSNDEAIQDGEGSLSDGAKLARIASHNRSVKTGKWVATDYKEGDLKSGSYEVQRGDTLWEISEAVYGSGFEWHKILDLNSGTIGFLPNGSQALIVPGQVLSIPAK